ncbi:hypothetical protein AGOR_G00042960 [Albula goreensis]|uniref:Uncharacterized protein n=1 Tax=Albula goreensis TaxID=1534307 RepID=A0A8T3DY75_9TELE|nr:hypothetical protein AGOR_G00042960 [Albula goreensis]
MGNGVNKVLPGLYLGNFKDARDKEQLARHNITHILSIHDSAAPLLQEMTYLCIPAADLPTQNLTQYFKESISFMHESRLKGEGCLVHCLAGVSRSVTLVVAYLMTVTGLGWQDALTAVRVARPCAGPNVGFLRQLEDFETTQAVHYRKWLKEKYKENPFNDEDEIQILLAQKPKSNNGTEYTSLGTRVIVLGCALGCYTVRDMNLDSDYGTSGSCGNGKLRQWLIEQIDSGKYPGLVWESDDKTIFRIPWKHAGKQDYNRDEDAALFKAWALFKGKFREGLDKPDPPTWKTRLRCALNKSNDFDELVDRSQLDISDPYKVYRIIPEGAKRGAKMMGGEEPSALSNSHGYPMHPPYPQLQSQVPGYLPHERREWREYTAEPQTPAELQFGQCPYPPRNLPWQGLSCENGYQITGSFYTCSPSEPLPPAFSLEPSMRSAEAMALSDCRLHISLFYRDSLVKEATTTSPEGCRISTCLDDRLYGSTDQRLCQGRVFWEGPLAPYADKPNKLEKEQTCKLFDTQQFLTELQGYAYQGRPAPKFQVVLCFGDEYPDPQRHSKLITAQVEPVFAKQLLYFAQQSSSGGHYGRAYEMPEQSASPTEDYQRPVHHHALPE